MVRGPQRPRMPRGPQELLHPRLRRFQQDHLVPDLLRRPEGVPQAAAEEAERSQGNHEKEDTVTRIEKQMAIKNVIENTFAGKWQHRPLMWRQNKKLAI